jgi:hypothetical protein
MSKGCIGCSRVFHLQDDVHRNLGSHGASPVSGKKGQVNTLALRARPWLAPPSILATCCASNALSNWKQEQGGLGAVRSKIDLAARRVTLGHPSAGSCRQLDKGLMQLQDHRLRIGSSTSTSINSFAIFGHTEATRVSSSQEAQLSRSENMEWKHETFTIILILPTQAQRLTGALHCICIRIPYTLRISQYS